MTIVKIWKEQQVEEIGITISEHKIFKCLS